MDLLSYAIVQLNDAKSFLGYNGSDDNMKFLINSVTDYIEGSCNRRFKETTYTNEVYNGNNSCELVLKQCPVTAFSKLEENNSMGNSNDWNTIDSEDYWFDTVSGIVTLNRRFYKGNQNYRATYSAGYSTIPYDLQFLAMSLIKEFLTVKSSGGIKQESLGDHSITFESILQSNPALKDILNGYRLPVLAQ